MQNNRKRKLNRLKEYDYSQDGMYFVTICANIVGNNDYCSENGNNVGNKNFCSETNGNKNFCSENRNKNFCSENRNKNFCSLRPFGEIINGEMRLSEIGKVAQKCWREIPIHFPNTQLDEFIIMPNHIHGIIVIENIVGNNNYCSENGNNVGNNNYCSENGNIVGSKNFCSDTNRNKNFCSLRGPWQTKWARSLSSIIRGFKIGVTKWCNENFVGNNNDCSLRIWQKSYYDHIIRNENSLNKIRDYIINNPLKWEIDKNNAENLWM